jgi:PAS domain S-box-containing protein
MTPWSDSILADAGMLRAALESLPDALILADTAGIIRFWNGAAERLFGHTRDEALGQDLNLLVPERFRPAHDEGFTRAVATGQLRTGTRVLRTRANPKDGRRLYVDFTFALLKDPAGRVVGVHALARDATQAHLQQQSAAPSGTKP